MTSRLLTVGFTRGDSGTYHEDDMQDVVTFFLELRGEDELIPIEAMATFVYSASNSEYEIVEASIPGKIQRALARFDVPTVAAGDTLTFKGETVVYERRGYLRKVKRNG